MDTNIAMNMAIASGEWVVATLPVATLIPSSVC
jgi:hypothetical protein